ncbi:MAG: transposase [Pirellulales bacterium]|nr:transposase [Pirellulales bacterium]
MERELWMIVSRLITSLDRHFSKGRKTHSVGTIVRVYLWSVLHERPVCWACQQKNWRTVKAPVQLPDQSTMSRRLRDAATQKMLQQLTEKLALSDRRSLVRYLDGKPLTVSRHSIDPDAAHGRGAGGKDRGYKFHAIYAEGNAPLAWSVTPLNCNEHHAAIPLIDERLGPGYLLADANYDANHLYDHASQHDIQLLTPKRYAKAKGFGRCYQSSYRVDALTRLDGPSPFVRQLLKLRKNVETRFAHLTNFGGGLIGLPPWVRRIHRVKLWITAKIILRLARDNNLRKLAA